LLRHFKSSIWLGVKNHMVTILDNSIWLIGNGDLINFWLDNWLGTPLVDIFDIQASSHRQLSTLLSTIIIDGKL